jgi:hypothetical protein
VATFEQALVAFYGGELLGETAYSVLYAAATDRIEKRKWATLLQLETETKAWLRAFMLARDLSVAEDLADRTAAATMAQAMVGVAWRQQMQMLSHGITAEYLPKYRAYATAVEARGEAQAAAVCWHMVAHEAAQAEFARRELAGDSEKSLAPIEGLLRYPLDSHGSAGS